MKKKFFYTNLIIFLIIICCVCLYNYKLDPYGMWKEDYSNQVLEPNKNYIKTKYILNNPDKYDSFIFGSSRVGAIEAELIPNGNYYNMTYSQGLPAEWLDNVETFLENGVRIKNVIIALDDFSFTVDPSSHYKEPLRIPYSKLNNPFKFFKYYLLRDPNDLYNRETIKGDKINHRDGANMDLYGTGRGFNTFSDEIKYLSEITDEELKADRYNNPTVYFDLNRISKTIEEIQSLKDLCIDNNINLTVIFNPIHHTTYEAIDKDILKDALTELAKVTDFWNFTSPNSISSNNYYWLETSHYRLIVGRMILERVFGLDLSVETPEDFGIPPRS